MTDEKKREKGARRKVEMPVGAVYALLAALSLICVTIMAVVLGGEDETAAPPPDIRSPHLKIEDVFFMSYESHGIWVELTIYVTNDGRADARDVKVHAWPVLEISNMATYRAVADLGTINVNQTIEETMKIELEVAHMHSVELRLFESGMLILKGRAKVSTEGEGGTQYMDYDVRGSGDDGDYDGIPDEWEGYYGLDPDDPGDAYEDYDGDGVTNIDEYRMGRNPKDSGPSCAPEMDDDDMGGIPLSGDEGAAFIGSALFLLVIIGVIIALAVTAAVSHRKKRQREERSGRKPIPLSPKPQRPIGPGAGVGGRRWDEGAYTANLMTPLEKAEDGGSMPCESPNGNAQGGNRREDLIYGKE